MKTLKLILFIALLPIAVLAQTDSTTLTKVGDKLPDFSFEIEKGKTVNIADYKVKLVLIHFFAAQSIPRNVIADENGKIIYQSIGFNEKEFNEMVKLIEERMSKLAK